MYGPLIMRGNQTTGPTNGLRVYVLYIPSLTCRARLETADKFAAKRGPLVESEGQKRFFLGAASG